MKKEKMKLMKMNINCNLIHVGDQRGKLKESFDNVRLKKRLCYRP